MQLRPTTARPRTTSSSLRRRALCAWTQPSHRKLTSVGELRFEEALLATDANVRRLPVDGSQLERMHHLRTPGNALSMRRERWRARMMTS